MTSYVENESGITFDFDIEELALRIENQVLDMEQCPYEAQINLLVTDLDGIQEIKRENAENRLPPVRENLRIGGEQSQDHRRCCHEDTACRHRKRAQGNHTLFHPLLYAIHAVCTVVLTDKSGKCHTIGKSRIVQKPLHSGKDNHPCRRVCPEGIDAVLNQKRRNAHKYRLHSGRKPRGYNFRQLRSPATEP